MLSEKTRVTLTVGALIACVIALVGGTWSLSTYASSIKNEIIVLRKEFSESQIDRYTLAAASEQALRTAIENPGLRVPDPRNPGQVFEVREKVKTP